MPTTPVQALPYPASTDAPNGPVQLQALGLAVEPKLMMVFSTATDRDAKITAPTAGMVCWLQTPGCQAFYDGSAWYNQGRQRIVANRAARDALTNRITGDTTVEADSGSPFLWDGARWRGLWPSRYLYVPAVEVTAITNEVGIVRIDIPDMGCRYSAEFTAAAIVNKSVPGDLFHIVVHNGTGNPPPSLSGLTLTVEPVESGISGLLRRAQGAIGVQNGAYAIQVNVVRTAGSGEGAVSASGLNYANATIIPSWS
ncbi:hypothetical protein [Frankia sp. Cj3]|uniref:hypothetical protein n=1 Tax=Frankia sp. Cj3 TaxID=2880976 RepID=UPI001EF72F4A|nr:hypothetical protein [Frankia sp. Cj3]